MDYQFLGRTGIKVSPLCMGTMTFGSEADADESKQMFNCCIDAGINIFDCANKYSDGRAEEILGECIKPIRDQVMITSKASSRTGPGENDLGGSAKHLMLELEKSLKRLQTDYMDIYFLHYFDPAVSMETSLGFLDRAVKQGKILYTGVSNWAAWQIMKGLHVAHQNQLKRIDCIQPMYSLIKRQAEVEILPLAQDQQLGVLSYSPLGAGVLTGKYTKQKDGLTSRLNEKKYYDQRYAQQQNFEVATAFSNLADDMGVDPVALAIRWAMSHPGVTAPIIGARNLDQLSIALKALDMEMSDELRDRISSLTSPPPPAHDRWEEVVDPENRLR